MAAERTTSVRAVDGSPKAERPNAPAPLIDAEAAGELLGVPKTWVLAEARADRIPHVRLGRYVRFEVGELEVWWRSRRRGPVRTGSHPVSQVRDAA